MEIPPRLPPPPQIRFSKSLRQQQENEQLLNEIKYRNMKISERMSQKLYNIWILLTETIQNDEFLKSYSNFKDLVKLENIDEQLNNKNFILSFQLLIFVIDNINKILSDTDLIQEIMNADEHSNDTAITIENLEIQKKTEPSTGDKIDALIDSLTIPPETAHEIATELKKAGFEPKKRRKNKKTT